MIQIVMKPDKAPVVNHEGLYRAVFNCEELGFRVRARNAREAERKLMIVCRHELSNKLINFKAEDYPAYDKENSDGEETKEEGPKDSRIEDPDCPVASGTT